MSSHEIWQALDEDLHGDDGGHNASGIPKVTERTCVADKRDLTCAVSLDALALLPIQERRSPPWPTVVPMDKGNSGLKFMVDMFGLAIPVCPSLTCLLPEASP